MKTNMRHRTTMLPRVSKSRPLSFFSITPAKVDQFS